METNDVIEEMPRYFFRYQYAQPPVVPMAGWKHAGDCELLAGFRIFFVFVFCLKLRRPFFCGGVLLLVFVAAAAAVAVRLYV
jgi:hypothetical protein